ncbi:S41 family peptidase [Pseudoalteromonas phenolica]|uniref:S41 family peptidase n=1 Tax=Pseudoalteromonas phenolica TaxID=161398 RepID=UPI00110B07C3|nr:S41 family peptidase [Pseudoalteromonas phenolica]TMO53605.1 carboxyl-terminal protease [Pseudoalteromonas phenolica]
MKLNTLSFSIALALSATVLVGCGGGSSNNDNQQTTNPTTPSTNTGSTGGTVTEPTWTLNKYDPSSSFINQCETPRTGTDPYENAPYPDKAGTAMHEKMFLRSYTNETYLWYDEVEDNDPKSFDSVGDYFAQLKTTAITDSGKAKDQFHFSESYDDYKKEAQSGVVSGYGVKWAFISRTPPRILKVAFTQDGSPAANAGLLRGDTITAINGADISTADSAEVDKLNAGLQPKAGEEHTFTIKREGSEDPIEIVMTAGDVQSTPVQNAKVIQHADKKVGYVQFNQFISVGQDPLVAAFQQFSNENINELVLDMRYNGGGLVVMSAQLGYMVAGEEQTRASENNGAAKSAQNNAKVFSRTLRNDKLEAASAEEDYYTFENRKIDWSKSVYTNQILPSVDLDTVYILSSAGTCSASESLINGLRGIDVNVVLIGGQTCGKPYGFTPTPNCGEVYYTVQFKGANAKEFGDYADGFIPVENENSEAGLSARVPGCNIADDFSKQLGDTQEGMLAAALTHIETGACPVVAKETANRAPSIKQSIIDNSLSISQPFHPMRNGLVDIKVKEQ